MPATTTCDILFRPMSAELKFLPEGPYSASMGMLSWVAIQHGADATEGSLNILDLSSRQNQSYQLPGRPGFAFPTSRSGIYIVGAERSLGLFDIQSQEWTELTSGIDADVTNTIINDGVVYEDCVIFGCKDLEFATPKAGLYLWRQSSRQLEQVRGDQLCSNGKAVAESDGQLWLYDIDSPTKQIVRTPLDITAGVLNVDRTEVVVDLTSEGIFPDGMILTPDQSALIVAIYNPEDAEFGEARQYRISDGTRQHTWHCPGAAQVTCPQLIQSGERVRLVLTTAVEHIPTDRLLNQPNAGCLFIGDTDFDSIGQQPALMLDAAADA